MNVHISKNIFFKVFIFIVALGIAPHVFAGTIDPNGTGNQYAVLATDSSQINFNCNNCSVVVSDTALTGRAWSEVLGWISLNPDNGGVTNTSGTLSGYAWGEIAGWINFGPDTGGVTINSQGYFNGTAWSENFGWIVFACPSATSCVETDWSEATSESTGSIPPGTPSEGPEGETPGSEPGDTPATSAGDPGGGTTGFVPPDEPTDIPNMVSSIEEGDSSGFKKDIAKTNISKTSSFGLILGSQDLIPLFNPMLLIILLGLFFLSKTILTHSIVKWFRMLGLFFSRPQKYWGVVYDVGNGSPKSFARILLVDQSGKILRTTTNRDGMYGFPVTPGVYTLEIEGEDCSLSEKINKLYGHSYENKSFQIKSKQTRPIIHVATETREVEETSDFRLISYLLSSRLTHIVFWFGFTFSFISLFMVEGLLPYGLFFLYCVTLVHSLARGKRFLNKRGLVLDENGWSVPYAVIRFFSQASGEETEMVVADKEGSFFVELKKKEQYFTVEKRDSNTTYNEVYRSDSKLYKRGFMNAIIKINT